jgi:tetratricopeptide (TPR) repeat protein
LLASRRASALNKVKDCLELSKPFMDAERLHEVQEMSQEALQECESDEALGADHEDTIKVADSLAIALQGQGRYPEAFAVHQRILAWCEKNRSKNHLDTLRQKYNIALVYDCQGRYKEAEQLYREALDGTASNPLVGANHPEALRMLCSLAAVLDIQGHSAEAEKMFEKAREGQEEQLGYYHPDTLLTLHNLAISAQGRDDLNEAEERFLEVLEGQERTLGANHSSTLRTLGNLAFNYQLKGENQKAENCYQLTLEGQLKRLGDQHPDTVHTMQLISEFHEDIRKRGLQAKPEQKAGHKANTGVARTKSEKPKTASKIKRAVGAVEKGEKKVSPAPKKKIATKVPEQ